MRKIFAALLVISFVLPSADALPVRHAKEPETPEPDVPKPVVIKPSGPSFFQRLFSTGATPTPAPIRKSVATPTPTPAPVVKRRPRRPAPVEDTDSETPKVNATAKTTAAPKVKPVATAKADPPETTGSELPPPPKVKTAKTKIGGKKTAPAVKLDLTGMDDAAKFKAVKAQAAEDQEVKDLKARADGEVNEAAAQKALVAYNRALFKKIIEIEPSVSAYAEKVEAAMTRRLSAEKGRQ